MKSLSNIKPKILYIMSSYNLYGGTPKKTLDLMNYFGSNSVLYVYNDALKVYLERLNLHDSLNYRKNFESFKIQFKASGATIYEGFYGNNYFKHISTLKSVVDSHKISIVQTQFFKGELLGILLKFFRPKINLVIAYVSAVQHSAMKSILARQYYKKANGFIFISKYVEEQIEDKYPYIKKRKKRIIYNGTKEREVLNEISIKKEYFTILGIGALIELKNFQVIIKALSIIVNDNKLENIRFYIAGEGEYQNELIRLVNHLGLRKYVCLLGNQKDIGGLLKQANLFVHPSFNEGFGIAVVEAMFSEKPIIVSKVGALTELITDKKTGLLVDPNDEYQWAKTIFRMYKYPDIAKSYGSEAKKVATKIFSVENYVKNYEDFYKELLIK